MEIEISKGLEIFGLHKESGYRRMMRDLFKIDGNVSYDALKSLS